MAGSAPGGLQTLPQSLAMQRPAAGRGYLEIDRDERFILVRITLAKGRTTDANRAFSRRVSELLADGADVPAEELAVIMVENGRKDSSLGRGQASHLEIRPEAWR